MTDYESGDYATARRPIDWQAVFAGLPREFSREEKTKARCWHT